jgi:maltooligosyltrehalose trehalohydrolase
MPFFMTPALNARTLGVNFTSRGEAEVFLWAPHAVDVVVVLTVDNSKLKMKRHEQGYWSCITPKLKPGDRYSFAINGEGPLPDPASVSQPEGVHGPSEVVNLNKFLWTDSSWKNHSLENYIFYELHTGTFSQRGDFSGIEEHIHHLKNLGITAIEIMPVAQFPGTRNWGYDGVFPWAVQNSYGGPEALQHLVNTCHANEIAVVLDVVYNHIGPEGNYLENFGPYFTSKYKTPWGNAINFDDAGCDGVRHYFIENVLMWFRDFHIDALRLDAVHAIKDLSPKHILQEIREYVDQLSKETGRTHYLLAECDLNDVRYINPIHEHGYGMDAQWSDEFHHALRVAAGNKREGYYADFKGIRDLAKAYKNAYVYDGVYSEHRNKKFGTETTDQPGHRFIVFSQNHDQVGNRMLGERTSTLISFEMQKLLAAAVMMSPFLPLLFMGEEYGEPNPFLYFVSHSDNELIEAVRNGRKAEFAAFHAQGEAPDPQAEKTFEQSQLQWHLITTEPHATLFRYYQTLISLRKDLNPLKKTNRKNCSLKLFEDQCVLILQRWENDKHVLCFLNFSSNVQTISLFGVQEIWKKMLDSSTAEWGGNSQCSLSAGKFILQPESFLLCTNYV